MLLDHNVKTFHINITINLNSFLINNKYLVLKKEFGDRIEFYNSKGQLHSFNDNPAIEYLNGTKKWYKKNKLHRETGPAIIHYNGNKCWYKEGKLHRENGPACDYLNCKCWYKKGKLHRENGPAIDWYNGIKKWYLNGEELINKRFHKKA